MQPKEFRQIEAILRNAIRLENNTFEHYQHLSCDHALPKGIRGVLQHLAEEERAHRIRLAQEYRAMVTALKGRRARPAGPDMAVSMPPVIRYCINQETHGIAAAAVSFPGRLIGGDNVFFHPLSSRAIRGGLYFLYDVMGHEFVTTATSGFISRTLGGILEKRLAANGPINGPFLEDLLNQVNRAIIQQSKGHTTFLTLLCLLINPRVSTVTFANMGHDYPLVLTTDHQIEPLTGSQLLIGIDPKLKYTVRRAPFRSGETIVAYTDGLVEAKNRADEMFGRQRVIEAIVRLHRQKDGRHPRTVIQALLKALVKFTGSRDLNDEVSILAIRRV